MTEQHDLSKRQEERVARVLGGRTQPRSGAGWVRKGDVLGGRFLVECKRTSNKRSITLKAVDLETIRKHAIREGRSPALFFELNGRNYIVFHEDDVVQLLQEQGE